MVSVMFFVKGQQVKVSDMEGKTYSGTIYKIVIQPCSDDRNRPHALIFISQNKRFIEKEGDFGCASLWVDKLQSIELLNPA